MSTLQLEHDAQVIAPATVLLVAAGPRDRGVVGECLGRLGISVSRARDTGEALGALADHSFVLCIVDLAGEWAAMASIRALRAQHPRLPIVGVIDPNRPVAAAEAIHAGVSDLLPWPFGNQDVATVVANACDAASVGLASFVMTADSHSIRLVAQSLAMRQVMELIAAAADARGGVMICGEASTGREVAAQVIHAQGARSAGPFTSVDCRAASPDDLELQLFGCPADRQPAGAPRRSAERIARTSAVYEARGGTLFLANVVEAPSRVQAKLARLIRDCEAVLSDRRTLVDVDVRLMAAFDQNPEASLADGRLRRDLYERVAHSRIEMPPLRRRREDIPALAGSFLADLTSVSGAASPRFTRSALALLSALPWPGNGRELRGVLEALLKLADRPVIELEDVLQHVQLSGSAARLDPEGTLRDAKARFEREWISAMLVKHNGRVGDAARALGIQRTNLYRKVRQLNVARAFLVRKP